VIIEAEDLFHYGIMRRSGRYPWGSGDEYQHNKQLLMYISELRGQGLKDTDIAKGLGYESTTDFRDEITIAKAQLKQADIALALRLHDKGTGNTAAAARMGIPESTYRTLIAPGAKDKADNLERIKNMLVDEVNQKKQIDIGEGVENQLGITQTKLRAAVKWAHMEGYEVHTVKVPIVGSINETSIKTLNPPGTTWGEAKKNIGNVKQITSFSNDGGRTFGQIKPPMAINPKRVDVVYAEQGGSKADGVIYVRPGVEDISIGGKNYAQVRIQVGKDRYLKGMAIYKNDLPDGVDLQFHTNKSSTGNKLDAMKQLSDDPELPFGALISKQILKDMDTPKEKVSSVMNIVNEQGDWEKWNRTLSSQMLSKQSPVLAKQQLDVTYEQRRQRFDDIMALTNPTVKRHLLKEFSDSVDAASVHLKAAAMPGQATHVILPMNSIKPTEIYATQHNNGDRVVLVRHPHGGPFEIPELIVNNRNREAKKILGDSADAIGIHHSVAQRLSGADFDGDTVLVIPNNAGRVLHKPALEGLKDFDPVRAYPGFHGMPMIGNKQAEMGKISNLITDMTIHNASNDELARAIRHSMVVIDAEKGLNHKLSESDNNIKQLRAKYQRRPDGGSGAASTLISRARSRKMVDERKPRLAKRGGAIDKETGRLVFEPTGRLTSEGKPKQTRTTKLGDTQDAFTLSSGTPMEAVYATHSNKLKGLANEARLAMIKTPRAEKNASATVTYAHEVESLNAKLNLAKKNQPLERQAQAIANTQTRIRTDYNPNLEKKTIKKIKTQELDKARTRLGAHKAKIEITPKEWDAIQAGAISDTRLSDILDNANMDLVRDLATPKTTILMTSAKTARANSMLELGFTRTEVASALGVSLSTLDEST
jgi:hypothetical protein